MSDKRFLVHLQEGYQARVGKGYQMQAGSTLDPLKLTPPKGDTAIQPPVSVPPRPPPKAPSDGKSS